MGRSLGNGLDNTVFVITLADRGASVEISNNEEMLRASLTNFKARLTFGDDMFLRFVRSKIYGWRA